MNRQALEALVRFNAAGCAAARHPVCRCRCGGQLHGKVHSEEWVEEQVGLLAFERQMAVKSRSAERKTGEGRHSAAVNRRRSVKLTGRPKVCGLCCRTGHNRRTCPDRELWRWVHGPPVALRP